MKPSLLLQLKNWIKGHQFGFRGIMLLLLATGLAFWTIPGPGEEERSETTPQKMESPPQQEVSFRVTLFLPDSSVSGLEPLEKTITSGPLIDSRIEAALEVLLRHERFALLLPDILVREVFVSDKDAVISLDSGFRKNFNGGALTELLVVTSLVNMVVESFDEIEALTLLIDDRPADIFATHVDIGNRLKGERSFDRASGEVSGL